MINKVYYVIISCEIWTPANIDSQKIIFTSKYLCGVDMDIGLHFAFLTVILRFITLSYFDEFDSDFKDNRSLKPRGNEEITWSTQLSNGIKFTFSMGESARETTLAGSRLCQGVRQPRASGHTLANSVRPQ